MKLTVDTNILRDVIDPGRAGHGVAVKLLGLHQAARCDVALTTRVDVDVPHDPLWSEIEALPILQDLVGTVFRLDYSRVGFGDFLASDEQAREADELMDLLFPGADPNSRRHRNRIADVDHLIGHKAAKRDVFVTSDRAILRRKDELRDRFGITVMAAQEAVNHLDRIGGFAMKEERPKLVTIDEFRKIEKPARRSIAIFYTQQQLERAIKGLKPAARMSLVGPGLEIHPIPGGPGYLGFPVCGPDEVPVIGPNGQIRCVPTAFEDTTEPRDPIAPPERACALSLTVGGGLRCTGRCPGGGTCVRYFGLEGGAFRFRCFCLVRVPVRVATPRRGRA